MIGLTLAIAMAVQPQPGRFDSNWSDAYWFANGRFHECFERQMEEIEARSLTAQAMLDEAIAHCRRQWDARVAELRTDLRQLHPDWPDRTLDEYLEHTRRRFYDDRLYRLRLVTAETPRPNIE